MLFHQRCLDIAGSAKRYQIISETGYAIIVILFKPCLLLLLLLLLLLKGNTTIRFPHKIFMKLHIILGLKFPFKTRSHINLFLFFFRLRFYLFACSVDAFSPCQQIYSCWDAANNL